MADKGVRLATGTIARARHPDGRFWRNRANPAL